MLCREALATHALRIGFDPKVVYAGQCLHIDANERLLKTNQGRVHSIEDLLRVRTVWRGGGQRGHLVQPEVLFPRQPALEVGGVNPDNHRTMDYELWGRLLLAGVRFEYTDIPFGIFRHHEQQKTHDRWRTTQSLIATATRLLALANNLPSGMRQEILADLRAYELECWRRTGPLARLRLPRRVVMRLRTLIALLQQARQV
jgi:hypothetical protein